MTAAFVARFVELDIRGFAVELHILGKWTCKSTGPSLLKQDLLFIYLCLFLANQDRVLEVNMDQHQKFIVAGLEEEVLDITEEDIYKRECDPSN